MAVIQIHKTDALGGKRTSEPAFIQLQALGLVLLLISCIEIVTSESLKQLAMNWQTVIRFLATVGILLLPHVKLGPGDLSGPINEYRSLFPSGITSGACS